MKRNVDLTESRKFSSSFSDRVWSIRDILSDSINPKEKYPWVKHMSLLSNLLRSNNDKTILTGNAEERAYKLREKKFNEGVTCDRCGIDTSTKPWLKNKYLLCTKCDIEMNEDYNIGYWNKTRKYKFARAK